MSSPPTNEGTRNGTASGANSNAGSNLNIINAYATYVDSGSSITRNVDSANADSNHIDSNYLDSGTSTPPGASRPLSMTSDAATVIGHSKHDDNLKFDTAQILRDVAKKREQNGVLPRTLGVMFRNLNVVGLGATASYQTTMGSIFSPKVIAEQVSIARHPPLRNLLSGFEGVVLPGEMLLVLGRPGSGCTTLLKAISNQRGEFKAVLGDIYYDSILPSEHAAHFRGDVTYCPEDDIHFPTLTVENTLRFAAKTRAPAAPAREAGQSRDSFVGFAVKCLSEVFGLKHALGTVVGDEGIRGISGGEKKRVSIAETLSARGVVGCWDNSTRGLDSSTALEFGRALRTGTDLAHVTTIMTLYQAGESLYELFDKVCIISEGKMVYFGSAKTARKYFVEMGYEPIDRQTTADFLVAVTDPNGRKIRPGYESRPMPRTTDEMVAYFQASDAGRLNKQAVADFYNERVGKPKLAQAYRESAWQEHAKHVRRGSSYIASVPMQIRSVILRRIQILKGDWVTQSTVLFSFIFQGIIMGTVFFRAPKATDGFYSRGGILFFAILFGAISSLSEVSALYAQRPIVGRHQRAALYHPFVEAIALTIVDIPMTFVIQSVYAIILYFLTDLQRTPGQFFTFLLFIFTTVLFAKACFRTLASGFRREPGAQAVAGLMILVLVLYTGYMVPQPNMIGALRWITYINPMRYAFEGVIMNELHTLNATCSQLVPSGDGYANVALDNQVCNVVGSVPAQAFVDGNRYASLSYGYEFAHVWRNFGILVGFLIFFVSLLLGLTERNTLSAKDYPVVMFKRGSKSSVVQRGSAKGMRDEEKGNGNGNNDDGSDYGGRVIVQEEEENKKGNEKPRIEPGMKEKLRLEMNDVFSWQHVKYTVPVGNGEKRLLLDDVSGFVAPGRLTALMGESGAGKTTLLNVLAQRVDVGVVGGDRFVNGQSLPMDFQAQTGYCQQTDTHLAQSTVREALLFSAKLRQPADVSLEDKTAYVDVCLKMCGLEAYADAIVGSLGVEHRKRTTIAVELAAKPRLLLFLDEPTSGLDSQSAWAIVNFLRNLADNGQAILCTIHQPSGELFQVFDRLLLLRKGGQTVYFGDLGKNSRQLIDYFERNGAQSCGKNDNPAEWMLDVIGAGATATSTIDWHAVWNKSKEADQLQDEIEKIHVEGRKRPPVQTRRRSEYSAPWSYQFKELVQRGFQSYWRNPTYLVAKLVLNTFGGLLIGFTFFHAKDSLQGTQDKLFAVFMPTIIAVPLSNQIQAMYIELRHIYEIRERPSRMYSWTAQVASSLVVELPWNIFGSTMFFICWYWAVGFTHSRAGYTYLLYGIVFPMYYTTIAQAIASMAPNAVMAEVLFSTLFSFVIAFNGVLQPYANLGWWQWMYRISPYTYLIEGLYGQAIGRQNVTCAPKELVTIKPPSGMSCANYMEAFISRAGGYLTNPEATSGCSFCPVQSTDKYILDRFNIHYSHHWRNLGIVIGFAMLNIAAMFFLTYWFRIRKGSVLQSIKKRL